MYYKVSLYADARVEAPLEAYTSEPVLVEMAREGAIRRATQLAAKFLRIEALHFTHVEEWVWKDDAWFPILLPPVEWEAWNRGGSD
jgi:hypothetical protein